jgi:hypothetical protein
MRWGLCWLLWCGSVRGELIEDICVTLASFQEMADISHHLAHRCLGLSRPRQRLRVHIWAGLQSPPSGVISRSSCSRHVSKMLR